MAATAQDPGSTIAKPRYLQLADALRLAILSGALPANDQFPTESALCKAHGVSRFTVREALRRLQGEGLISRRRGSGTTVQPAAARGGARHQPLSNIGEVLQYASDTQIRFSARGIAPLPRRIAGQVSADTEGKWFHFRGIRTRDRDALAIAVTDVWVTAALGGAVERIDLGRGTIFHQVAAQAGISSARVTQDIQALPAGAEIASLLAIPRRSPSLRVLRCYFDADGRLFEVSASHHPGDLFAYSMQIEIGA